MANPKSFLTNQLEKLNIRHHASKRCDCPAAGLSLALSKLISDTVDEPFPGYENLFINLKDMLSEFAEQMLETNRNTQYAELYRLIEVSVKNLEEAIDLAPKPLPVKTATCIHDRRPVSKKPKVLGAFPESTVYSHPRYALTEMCQEGLDELVQELTATLKTFSNLPAARITKNLGCVVRAIKACRQALQRAPGICPDEVPTKKDKASSTHGSKYSEADERQILLESGLLTASEMELLLSGAPLTEAMKKKMGMALAMQDNADNDLLMNSGLLTESELEILRNGGEWTEAMKAKFQQLKDGQKQADMDKFLNSGLLTESEMEILRSGGEWTEEMKRKFAEMKLKEKDDEDRKRLLESGLLTESEMAILLAGGELTEAMRNKLLAIKTPGITESMRRLIASGKLTDSEMELLLSGGRMTDAMRSKLEEQRKKDEIQKLLDSGLLSESEKALLLAGGELTDAMKQKLAQIKEDEGLAAGGQLTAEEKAKAEEALKLKEAKSKAV